MTEAIFSGYKGSNLHHQKQMATRYGDLAMPPPHACSSLGALGLM